MLAIITPVSLADQHLDSFTTNQEQLMIISWPVWLRPTTALVGGAQPMAAGGGSTQAWPAPAGPSAAPFFPLAGEEGLINTERSLETARPPLGHTLD